jgi:hypothetical protein
MAIVLVGTAWAADSKGKKDFRVIGTTCNLDGRDTSSTGMGLTTCRYVCEDPDKTKVTRVFLSATAVCVKVIQEQVKQLIR